MRTPLIAGNWKMHKTAAETADFVKRLVPALQRVTNTEVLICPPFTALHEAGRALAEAGADGFTPALGAQNVHEATQGAHTGEISAEMLKETGCTYVIVGHSERRQAGETDERVNGKVRAALGAGLIPVLCVGESLEQRRAEQTEAVVTAQVIAGLKDVGGDDVAAMVIAYEPVWAIGSGETATPEEASRVAGLIRQTVAAHAGEEAARRVRIQYGGSVNADNIGSFMQVADVDGALVGGASLQPDSFAQIVLQTEAVAS